MQVYYGCELMIIKEEVPCGAVQVDECFTCFTLRNKKLNLII